MLSFIESMILGVVQGLTEWLPISSSGHMAMLQSFFGWDSPVLLYVLLHAGTLLVIVVFFRGDIALILRALARRDFGSEEGRIGIFVIVGSAPTAAIGFVCHDLLVSFFDNLMVVGLGLVATGILLVVCQRRKGEGDLGYVDALLVGTAQGAAIVPGVSRSGATISTGLLRGVKREMAFKFSFLLSIPAVLGAMALESSDFSTLMESVDVFGVVSGVAVSVVVGYFSLRALRNILARRKLHWFAPYCWVVGALLLISQVF